MDTSRVLIYARDDTFLFELDPSLVFGRVRTEEVNGEHSLEITTAEKLEKGQRVLTVDHTNTWREYIVTGTDEAHQTGSTVVGTYYCDWSVKHDLAGTVVDDMPGVQTPVSAAVALSSALSGTSRWTVGTVSRMTSGGASMWFQSGWDAIGTVLDTWGGEVGVTVGVDVNSGVISRRVNLFDKQGSTTAKRRFDYGHDLQGIRRKVEDEPNYCRIIPRGKGEETGEGGHGRKITIESVNGGKNYLQNDSAAQVFRLPDGNGGWEYPTLVVDNGDMETPADLKVWGLSVLNDYTTPKVTYEADVLQLAQAGMDVTGIALGDTVHCVDESFGDGLRIEGRVVKIVVNELDETDVKVTIGHVSDKFAQRFSSVKRVEKAVKDMNGGTLTVADYLNSLLQRVNTEINAAGGYTYITEGEGIRTYDVAVSDPLIGSEASAVVEIKGGTIRIANTKTAQGEWNWKTVFTSGHIAADMVTAAKLTAGYIGSPSGNYWNLDTGELKMANTASFIDKSGKALTVDDFVDLAQTADTEAKQATKKADAAEKKATQSAGGTNLLIDSDEFGFTRNHADANRKKIANNADEYSIEPYQINVEDRPVVSVRYAVRFLFHRGQLGDYAGIGYYDGKAVDMIEGQRYTVSCWAKRFAGEANLYFQLSQTKDKASKHLAVSGKWRRYSYSFIFRQAEVGGTKGARVSFMCESLTNDVTWLLIAGMKLEIGGKSSDWSNAPIEDRKYTDAISAKDREYTKQQRKALDASFNQEKVFNRLTRNGKAQGVYMKNGNLYLNGSYIKAGTVNAGIIKAGILSDKKGKNKWNLASGYFYTKNGELHNCNVMGKLTSVGANGINVRMENGVLRMYDKNKNATFALDGGEIDKGAEMRVARDLRIKIPGDLEIWNNNGISWGANGQFTLKNLVFNLRQTAGGGMSWQSADVTFSFRKGFVIGVTEVSSVTKWTNKNW